MMFLLLPACYRADFTFAAYYHAIQALEKYFKGLALSSIE
jgi:hypothetical protein